MHPGLKQLVGREVSSVEFVRGYVQIRFDGPCLSAYTMPIIVLASGRDLRSTTLGYADAFITTIGASIDRVEDSLEFIALHCTNGITIKISLVDAERRVDEAATLETDDRKIWSW
jgi:hypothetical protein